MPKTKTSRWLHEGTKNEVESSVLNYQKISFSKSVKIDKKKLNKQLKIEGYKKKKLSDNSGYWFEKKIKLFKKIKGVKFIAYVDDEFNHFVIDCNNEDFLKFKTYKKLEKFIKMNSR